jgi:hypothetical protein
MMFFSFFRSVEGLDLINKLKQLKKENIIQDRCDGGSGGADTGTVGYTLYG